MPFLLATYSQSYYWSADVVPTSIGPSIDVAGHGFTTVYSRIQQYNPWFLVVTATLGSVDVVETLPSSNPVLEPLSLPGGTIPVTFFTRTFYAGGFSTELPSGTHQWPPPEEPAHLVSITAAQPTGVSEGDSGEATPLSFLLTLNHAAATEFTVEVDFQAGEPLKYVNAVAGVDWVGPVLNSLKTLVTFHKGETQARATVQVVGDALIEPDEFLTAQIVSTSDPTVEISQTNNSATATILNDDVGPQNDVDVNGLVDPAFANLLLQDIKAAVGRIEKALDNRVPHLEIDVVFGPTPNALASALPEYSKSVVGADGSSIQLPNALYEKLFPAQGDPNGPGADMKLFLDLNEVSQYYSGKTEVDVNSVAHGAIDVTTLLTHEILHGLGFGAGGPWKFLTKSGEFRGSKEIDAHVQLSTVDFSHLADTSDLMGGEKPAPAPIGVLAPTPISKLDIAILEDLGWGAGKPGWLPHTIAKVERFFDSATGDHFYTPSSAEADQIRATLPTYHDEGAPWSTPDKGADTIDVFRFFDVATGAHFLTTSTAERDQVLATLPSYHFEGIAFEAYTAPADGTLTLERFFNTQSHLHHYAASPAEIASILNGDAGPGWVDEGAGFVVHA
jgi:Repeat of unknown function (DUF5648)